jgi:hypothetical protein
VANTRWWPPFCMVVDWVVAAIIVVEIAAALRLTAAGVGPAPPAPRAPTRSARRSGRGRCHPPACRSPRGSSP